MSKVVVISGASSGIGLETARYLAKQGYTVYGLARHKPQGVLPFSFLMTDISNSASIQETVSSLLEKETHIDALINCAGMGISGAIQHTALEDVQKMFDVNLFGTFALTKALIPALRESKGMILNISSVAGVLTVPFQTFYSMSKSALNTFSEGLRMEVKPLGIRVVSVLPGDTKTGFTAAREHVASTDPAYTKRLEKSLSRMEKDEQNGKSPLSVAKACARLLKRKHPPVKVTVGFDYKLFVFLKKILPTRFVNWILFLMYAQ